MTQYYVNGNLKHNGDEYKRGDVFEAGESIAAPLIEAGVLQTDPIEEQKPVEQAPVEEQKAEPVVGGAPMQTGEPSIDGPQKPAEAPQPKPQGFLGKAAAAITGGGSKPAQEPSKDTKEPDTTKEPDKDPSAGL